ncbi:hypothetical protein KEM54_004286 [Ascosphaera aggregata]|nr:hypothetical protein KEM54_004286 [Ascosphaera aggregata]
MADIQSFILVADSDQAEALSIAAATAQKIVSKEANLIDVVQSLGSYINDEDAIIRGKAVSYLSGVITALPDDYLTRQQIDVLTEFFCNRIQDGGAVSGLDRLQSLKRFTGDMTRSAAKAMGDESLLGIVNLVTGERDPRNLMITFSIIRVVMIEWSIADHVELLFESVYNYFPITFKPPPNDQYKITAQDLKQRLQDCLSSNSLFAPLVFPALIDKLDSTSFNVKKDAIIALGACASAYHATVVSRYSLTIWDALKFEILNVQEEILSDESKRVLRTIAQRLSGLEGPHLVQYLKPILKECDEQIQEPLHKQAKPAQEIMRQLAAASVACFNIIAAIVMPSLVGIYAGSDSIAKRRGILEAFLALFSAGNDVYKSRPSSDTSVIDSPLFQHREQVLDVLSSALMGSAKDDMTFRVTALRSLLELSTIPRLLSDSEVGLFIKHMNHILLLESIESPQLQKQVVAALATLSTFRPSLIINITFPALMSTLPDREDEMRKQEYTTTLDSLANMSVEKTVFETLVRRLLSKFDISIQATDCAAGDYPAVLLKSILSAMEQHEDVTDQSTLIPYFDKIVVNFSKKAALASTGKHTATSLTDPSTLDVLGRIFNIIVKHSPAETQARICENVYTLFAEDDGFTPVPATREPTQTQKRTIILSTYILAGLPKDFKVPTIDFEGTSPLQRLIDLTANETDISCQLALSRHLAVLVNKFIPESGMALPSDILSNLLSSNTSVLSESRALAIFWLSKAMILRLAPKTPQILESLVGFLRSPDVTTSTMAANHFPLLLAPDHLLSAANGANIRLLAKQRVFSIVVPMVSDNVRDVNQSLADTPTDIGKQSFSQVKTSLLTALIGLIAHVPSNLLVSEISTLLPLFLQTLDLEALESVKIKFITLATLSLFIEENGISLINEAGYVESLVKRLTAVGIAPKPYRKTSNPPHIRIRALRCLRLIAQNQSRSDFTRKSSPLLALRDSVIYGLRPSLDDPKRDVRKAAVDARAAWFRDVDPTTDDS